MFSKSIFSKSLLLMSAALAAGSVISACDDDDIDNTYSRSNSVVQLTASATTVVLDEARPDEVALTLEWCPAHEYGNEYITTYQYTYDVSESRSSARKEYEDDGVFTRSYTNRELQELLTGHFAGLTSTYYTMNFNVTAEFNGPRTVIPDIATATVRVKTYGPKQFLADRLYMADASGAEVELSPTTAGSGIYTYLGRLVAGPINFPVDYADEANAIAPASGVDTPITEEEMEAAMVDRAGAAHWIVPADDNYRVTVNVNSHTVKIVAAGAVVEVDQLFLGGSAVVGDEEIEVARTLEDDAIYAWRGELQPGTLNFPILFQEQRSIVIVPKQGSDVTDATPMDFNQTPATTLGGQGWTIAAADTYRIVVNTTDHTVTIYSSASDLTPVSVSYNNTVEGINPYTQEVTELWMYGGFNNWGHDSGLKTGFQQKYTLQPSVADPQVFVYSGEALPRGSSITTWSGDTSVEPGCFNFLVSNIENNVYAYGSTAAAKRNSSHGFYIPSFGAEETLVGGQSDNRYAYFCPPEGCNFVVVNLRTMTVRFDIKN